jgi:hypothetical protein
MMRRNIYFILLITVAGLLGTSPLHAQPNRSVKDKTTTSIEVAMVGVDNVSVPIEFQVSLYENLLQKLNSNSDFYVVYRDGNKDAQTNKHLLRMHSTITAFKEGSERDRQVTTVKGATKIMVHCQFTDNQGTVLLQRDIEGKVLFFGNNLKATEDFAKKAAKAADEALTLDRARLEHEGGA